MSSRMKAQAIKFTGIAIFDTSNYIRLKDRAILKELSNTTRSVNPSLHSHSYDNVYIFTLYCN